MKAEEEIENQDLKYEALQADVLFEKTEDDVKWGCFKGNYGKRTTCQFFSTFIIWICILSLVGVLCLAVYARIQAVKNQETQDVNVDATTGTDVFAP